VDHRLVQHQRWARPAPGLTLTIYSFSQVTLFYTLTEGSPLGATKHWPKASIIVCNVPSRESPSTAMISMLGY